MVTTPDEVPCDCGHLKKDHYNGEGQCHDKGHAHAGQCGCTYYYPNAKHIKSNQPRPLVGRHSHTWK
jgi:hypothetical protein